MTTTRRDALISMSTIMGMLAARRLGAADFPAALGVQLYTLRDQLGPALDSTLEAIAKIGYRELESLRPVMPALGPLLAKHGLTAPSGHLDAWLVTGNREAWAKMGGAPADVTLESVIDKAAALKMKYLVLAYLAPAERQTLDDYKRTADQMNEVAQQCKKAGMAFCYHHHSFEFEKLGGERPWDVLLSRADPSLVGIEADVFWLATAGEDPVKEIRRLGSRVKLLHLKDRAKDAPVTFDERNVPPTAFKEVGAGAIDFPAVLRAARDVGAAHFFVEQDQTPGKPIDSLQQSYKNLRAMTI